RGAGVVHGDTPVRFPGPDTGRRRSRRREDDGMARRAKRMKSSADPVQRAAIMRDRYHRQQVRRAAKPTPDWVIARVNAWAGKQYIGKPSRVPPVSGLTSEHKASNRRIRQDRAVKIHASGKPGRTAPTYD